MPNPNAIVSSTIRFEPQLEGPPAEMLRAKGGISLLLEGDQQVRLSPDDPRSAGFAQILEGLSKQKLPVYLEVDPETSAISRLLIPHVTRVINIRQLDDDALGIELEMSHARHVLRKSSPDFEALEKRLREALDSGKPVIFTEDDAHEVIDIRDFLPGPEGPPLPFAKPEPLPQLAWPWRWIKELFAWPCWWPWKLWFCCISEKKAQQVFNAMNATSCDPLTVPPPCIPFLYPDDGCWGRAHEMCRLMINMGLKPKKVWIQGSLHVSTKNNPNCSVWWGWHVAPTLCVRRSGFFFFLTRQMVIDPSLFTTPVTKTTWKSVQGDPSATLTDSSASIFYLWGNVTDPNYVQTNQVLATYRLQLQNRALQFGPPPYANCP